MQHLYTATIFAGALVCLLASVLLFLRRKEGNRSRVILAVIVSFSVYNYISRFVALLNGIDPELVVSAKLLLQANFMLLGYILYPIEVIAPGWLNRWRVLRLYGYWLLLVGIYVFTRWAGVEYTTFGSLLEMIPHANRFEVGFRLFLSLLIFVPVVIVFFIHRTRLYQNSDHIWVKKYIATLSLNIVAYLMVILFNNPVFNIAYYYISVGCSIYIVYMELFDRLIILQPRAAGTSLQQEFEEQEVDLPQLPDTSDCNEAINDLNAEDTGQRTKELRLIEQLKHYLTTNQAWRNPDLSLNMLASELMTNRTSLGNALRTCGHENYSVYINRLRIEDFIHQLESGAITNFQDAFFHVGFRSRSTALRNFRQFTGTTPSDYFNKKEIKVEENE